MLRHYIKMAMRHLLKNKIQNLISIVGLSVGILCFSICLYCSRFISEVDSCFSNKELIADIYNPQIQISAESETKRSIFREKDKTKRSKKESAQHSKSRNKSFVMTSVSAL